MQTHAKEPCGQAAVHQRVRDHTGQAAVDVVLLHRAEDAALLRGIPHSSRVKGLDGGNVDDGYRNALRFQSGCRGHHGIENASGGDYSGVTAVAEHLRPTGRQLIVLVKVFGLTVHCQTDIHRAGTPIGFLHTGVRLPGRGGRKDR